MTIFLQLVVSGLSLGAIYALVALGFVVVFKATDVFNLAQGALVAVGALIVFWLGPLGLGAPFYLAVLGGALVMAAFGLVLERFVLRRMFGKPLYSTLILTLALATVLQAVFERVVGPINQALGDPLSDRNFRVGGVVIDWVDIRTIAVALVAVAVFFVFFQKTTFGVAMRATAADQEAATAMGISSRRVAGAAWAISGVLATLAGVSVAAQPPYLYAELPLIAFLAIPAAILGGLDSPAGAVVGGFIIGIVQALIGYYAAEYASWLGPNFGVLAPYLVMFFVMLVRPHGLFGTPEVRRL